MTYMLAMIFFPLIVATLCLLVNKPVFNRVVFLLQLVLTYLYAMIFSSFIQGGVIIDVIGGWSNYVGVELIIDIENLLLMGLTLFIYWIIYIYSLEHELMESQFTFFMTALQGPLYGIFMVNDLFSFFVLFELITVISTILIAYKRNVSSLLSALQYIIFNSFGMLVYLFAIVYLYNIAGSFNMTHVREYILMNQGQEGLHLVYALLLSAIALKTAMFPISEWLARAHSSAPGPVSALLSGILIKVGIYGLILLKGLFTFESFDIFVSTLGFVTAIYGAIKAISEVDLKKILAYHTVSQMGLITYGLFLGGPYSYMGGLFHIVNHLCFKGLLFLSANSIQKLYGTKNIHHITGLWNKNKVIAIALVCGILAITGFPLSIAFVSKGMMKLKVASDLEWFKVQLMALGTILSFVKLYKLFPGLSFPESIKKSEATGLMLLSAVTIILIPTEWFALSVLHIPMKFKLVDVLLYFVMVAFAYFFSTRVVNYEPGWLLAIRHEKISFEQLNIRFLLLIICFLTVIAGIGI